MKIVINNLALFCSLTNLLVSYFVGILVVRGKIPTFVSRKIIHILFFLMPFVIAQYAHQSQLQNFGYSLAFFTILRYSLYYEPLRKRFSFLNYAFASVDRVSDRPYVLRLLFIQRISQLVIINLSTYFYPRFSKDAMFYTIAYLALTFGDGLAEPVGKLIKSYRYKVYSIFNTKENYRTLAGSLCVYIVTFDLIIFYYPIQRPEFFYQLAIVPLVTTIIEGISPKSLDNAFVFAGCLFALHAVNVFF